MWDLIQLFLLGAFCLFLFANAGNAMNIAMKIIVPIMDIFDISKWGKK